MTLYHTFVSSARARWILLKPFFSEIFQHIRSDSQWFAMVTRDERSPVGVSRSFPMVSRSCLDHFSTCEKDLVVFTSWYLPIICIHMYDLFYVYNIYIIYFLFMYICRVTNPVKLGTLNFCEKRWLILVCNLCEDPRPLPPYSAWCKSEFSSNISKSSHKDCRQKW